MIIIYRCEISGRARGPQTGAQWWLQTRDDAGAQPEPNILRNIFIIIINIIWLDV